MLTYLDKFNNLPADIRASIETEAVLSTIENLEKKYGISLASVVMRVMVKEIAMVDLPKFFVFEFGLDGRTAEELVEDLKEKVFLGAADYLGYAVSDAQAIESESDLGQWAKNTKTEADVQGSSFFFSPEDEEEVRALAKRVDTMAPAKTEKKVEDDLIEQKIEEICKKLKVSFSSQELNDRFRKIMGTYLKGIRNKVDTKQTLIKAIDAGGLSMDAIYVDNILLVADKINLEFVPKVDETKKVEAKKNIVGWQEGGRDVPYDFSSLKKDTVTAKEKVASSANTDSLRFVDESKIESPLIQPAKTIKDIAKDEGEVIDLTNIDYRPEKKEIELSDLADAVADTKTKKIETPNNIAAARPAVSYNRNKLQDVKTRPKLTGPVDEIGEFDLVNFRRLNSDPEIVASKIKQKIKNLEDENYSKKIAGIKSWRQSPVNQLYLLIGQRSLAGRKSVPDIIKEAQDRGEEILTNEEFETIVRLNKDLKY